MPAIENYQYLFFLIVTIRKRRAVEAVGCGGQTEGRSATAAKIVKFVFPMCSEHNTLNIS